MSISLQDNLDILNKKQNVKRDAFKTIEEMKAFPSTSLPPVFHAMCEDDGCLYIYNVNNSENDTTGKWRKFECSTNGTGGTNGKDGVSPTVSITTTDTGHTVKITDVNGVNSFDVLNGKDGVNGTNGQDGTDGIGITKIEKTKTEGLVDTYTITFSDDSTFEYTVTNGTDGTDGVSPTITVTEIDDGHTITITDADGTQSFNVLNGADGADGYSPNAKVEKENGVVTITITDKTGTTTAAIKENDGVGGAGEENVIEEIKVNGVALTPDENKSVDITVPTVDVDKDYVDTELAKKANISDIPTKVSELQNDSNYQTDTDVTTTLTPYATKTYVGEQISNADHLKREIVTEIPDASTADEHTIYMLKIESATGNDKYREYLLIDETMQCVCDTSVDLTDYAKTADIDKKLDNKADKTEILTFTNKTVLDGITAEKVADWDEAVETKTNLEAHTNSIVSSKTGVHGMRYFNDTLQVQNEAGEWVDIETGGSGGIAPNNVGNLSVKVGNEKLTLFWDDPEDTVVEGQTLCTWAGTKLVMKQGAFPDSVKDGTQLVDNRVRDQYKTTGFTITGLTNDTTYYFQLFPYSDQKVYNNRAANQFTGTPKAFVTLGIEINLSDSNPATWATYTDDAVGMTAGSSAFDDYDIYGNIQSYTFKDGAEVKALSKTDVTKYADGTSAATDIASGTYDVMTKFTRGGYYINHSNGKLIIKVTDDPEAEGFCYKAFQRGANELDEFYLGRYKGYIDGSGKLRSYSGVTPTGNKTIGAFRTAAQLNGAGYENSGFYQLVWRQCLYLVKYLAKNSQDTIGKGYTGGNAVTATGSTNGHGDTYGTQTATDHMILFGLEDFWGNIWEWIDGLATDASYNILTNTDNFQDDGKGTGYQSTASGASSNDGGYMTDVQGTNDTGLVYKTKNGSATTYFCDGGYLYSSCVAAFGGYYSNGDYAGVCYLNVSNTASDANARIGGRVMFLKKQAS